jgi:hypothetical protein
LALAAAAWAAAVDDDDEEEVVVVVEEALQRGLPGGSRQYIWLCFKTKIQKIKKGI